MSNPSTSDSARSESNGVSAVGWADYGWLGLAVAASRLALYAAGLRFNFINDWMFLADPQDLRERLLETVYYFHAFPPGMNLLTGFLLKLSEPHVAGLAHAVFIASGLLLTCSLLYLLRAIDLPRPAAWGVAFGFSLIPPTLYFENLYLYDYPVPALLACCGALLHRALCCGTRQGRAAFWRWLPLFGICALLTWLRSGLQLVWYAATVALCVYAAPRIARRHVLAAAALPTLFILALSLKNWFVFGVFGSQAQSGGNFMPVTIYQMPAELRRRWVDEGKLSPFSNLSWAEGPEAFIPYLGDPDSERWPQLSALERPSLRAPNFNHWFYLEVSKERQADALYCLRQRPRTYVNTVLKKGLPQLFSPTTEWHQATGTPDSPHYLHRQVLGAYERRYNRFVHGRFLAPYGWYALLPFACAWALISGRALFRSRDEAEHARGAVLLYCLLQIAYLCAVVVLATLGENARYRYIVEPLIWVVSAGATAALFERMRSRGFFASASTRAFTAVLPRLRATKVMAVSRARPTKRR